ncbi:predicted protein [Botrytis cinerea T4]|uniref:Uncharacterized protein n=1 Tax=Botryotinia fuckeliana (strain T4) TaxID=999810 RepID=G2Y433_BOTF4|nr:predicted protein [Botrytis cinerea T4]
MRGGGPYQEPTSEASPGEKITWDKYSGVLPGSYERFGDIIIHVYLEAIRTECFEKCGSSEAFLLAVFTHHVNYPHEKKRTRCVAM